MESDRLAEATVRVASSVTRRRGAALLGALGIASTGPADPVAAKKKKKKNPKNHGAKTTTTQPPTTSGGTTTTTPPGPQLVYACPPPANYATDWISPSTRTAQTFMPSRVGPLRRIVFLTDNPAGSDESYIVELLETNGVIPMHLPEHVLTSVVVPGNAVPFGDRVRIVGDFIGPVLKRQTVYAAALRRGGSSVAHKYAYRLDNGCSGRAFFAVEGEAFSPLGFHSADEVYDIMVEVYID
jgi:hypothetical protein